MNKFLFSFSFLLISGFILAQPVKNKWGEVPESDLKMTVYPQDSAASAVILQDIGDISIRALSGRYNAILVQVRQLKVFDPKAFDQGNLSISYYSYKNSQRIRDLDVYLYLPNGEKQKVKSDNIFTEKVNEYWSTAKVFIPNLQKGCVIEYRYELASDNIYQLFDWYFQHDLPVRLSELTLALPGEFEYVFLTNASSEMVKKTVEKRLDLEKVLANVYTLTNQPAIKEEPYVNNTDDFRSHIRFQLQRYSPANQLPQDIFTTWEALAKDLEKHDDFGHQYSKKTAKADKLWDAFEPLVDVKNDSALLIAEKALRFISSNITWNERYSFLAANDLDDVYKNKTGSSAEINLALVSLLKRAGLEAAPALVSTRRHGQMYPLYPFTDQFNSVVAHLQVGDRQLLLDATHPFMKLGEMRVEHYNGSAWVADSKRQAWLDFGPAELADVWLGDVTLSETGDLDGTFSIMSDGMLARSWRSDLEGADPADFIKKEFFEKYPGAQIDSVVVFDQKNVANPLKITFKCHLTSIADIVNGYIYFSPGIHAFFDSNPFKSATRYFPINFPYQVRADFILNMKLPAGYQVEELPKPQRTLLPNNGGRTTLNCSQPAPGTLQFTVRTKLSQTDFRAEDYNSLRQFTDAAVKYATTQLVLKHP